jgi:exodeoxyribonuclease V beta subunit
VAPAPPAAELFPRLDSDLRQRRIVLRSFSSLHRERLRAAPETPVYATWLPRADDDMPDTLDAKTAFRGPVFGAVVHAVLQKIDFAAVAAAADADALLAGRSPSRTLIDEQFALHLGEAAASEEGRRLIARLVWHGIRTPLTILGSPLADVPAEDRLHELEFTFPDSDGPPPPEVRRQEGFLTGVIDLVVRRGNRYFLVDWKTNDLAGVYGPSQLTQNMRDCDYYRQYRLYLQALARWLSRTRGKAFDVLRDFGGVYYLYLRGMNGVDESAGVFFARPTAEDLLLERVLGK